MTLAASSAARAADWPPTLDPQNTVTQALDGRVIERYTHGPRAEWGYPATASAEWAYAPCQETGAAQQNHNSFYLVAPKEPREHAPLCVVLHSANRTAYDYLGFGVLGRKIDRGDDPASVMAPGPPEMYVLYLNSTNAEWWGWSAASQNAAILISSSPPAELRVMDTIEWVINKLNIDRNRIYLCGVSMGGCGTLGIGMHHGDVFAAIRANVPAGTNYANYSLGGFAPSPSFDAPQAERDAWLVRASAVGHPDPPITFDFSSQSDNWSMTEPALVQAAQAGRLPLILAWGGFGHATFGSLIEKFPPAEATLAFPWLEIRKNEAYPVFTHASCDQRCPWLNAPAEYDATGQINALFRWKCAEDTPARISLKLWIEHPQLKNGTMPMPDAATAWITLRRLQQFKPVGGKSYQWTLTRDGKTVAHGNVALDATGLLTVRDIPLTTAPSEFSVVAAQSKHP